MYLQVFRSVCGKIVKPELDATTDRLATLLTRERVVVVGEVPLENGWVVVHPSALRTRMLAGS